MCSIRRLFLSIVLIILYSYSTIDLSYQEPDQQRICQTAFPPCPLNGCSSYYGCKQKSDVSCYCQYIGHDAGLKAFKQVLNQKFVSVNFSKIFVFYVLAFGKQRRFSCTKALRIFTCFIYLPSNIVYGSLFLSFH